MDSYGLFNLELLKASPINVADNPKQYDFKLNKTLRATSQRKLVPIRINKSDNKLNILNDRGDRSVIHKMFAPSEQAALNRPDTLDDPDIDELFLDAESQEVPQEVNLNGDVIETTIVVFDSSLELLGSADYYSLHTKISDCKTIRHGNNRSDDTILVTTVDNIIFSVVYDENLKPYILHWWSLAHHTRYGDWQILVHPNGNHFIVYEKRQGSIKFYKLQDSSPYHIELVRNMALLGTELSSCAYIMSNGEAVLFLVGLKSSKVYYYLFSWPLDANSKPEVHQYAIPDGKLIQYALTFNNNYVLCVRKTMVDLLSVHELYSSEGYGNQPIDRSQFGDITHSEYDSLLLSKLKLVEPTVYGSFTHCVLFSTSNYSICAALMDDTGTIKFYEITRFKGLCTFVLLPSQNSTASNYHLEIVSFGKVFELVLKITDLAQLKTDSNIESMNNIIHRYSKDASFTISDQLITVGSKDSFPSKNNEFQVWLCSPSCVSNVSLNGPVEHYRSHLYLREFQYFSSMTVLRLSDLTFLLFERFNITVNEPNGYLIVASDLSSVTKAFLVYLVEDNGMECDELEDVIVEQNCGTVHYFVTESTTVQVGKQKLYFSSLSGEAETWSLDLAHPVKGAISRNSTLLLWSGPKFLYIENVDLKDTLEHTKFFHVPDLLNGYHSTSISFENEDISNIVSALFCDDGTKFILFLTCATLHCKFDVEGATVVLEDVVMHDETVTIDTIRTSEGILSTTFSTLTGLGGITLNGDQFLHPLKGWFKLESAGGDSFFAYNSSELFSYEILTKSQYSIKLPSWRKSEPIFELRCSKDLLFVLFGDGLRIYHKAYKSYSASNIVLNATRCRKKFVYLDKINRLLVVNCTKKLLECIKLENSKVISLDTNNLFNDIDELHDVQLLSSDIAQEFLARGKNNESLLAFSCSSGSAIHRIKVIAVIPSPGQLLSRVLASLEVPAPSCGGRIKPLADNQLWTASENTICRYKLIPSSESTSHVLQKNYEWTVPSTATFDAREFMVVNVTTDGSLQVLLLPSGHVYIQNTDTLTRQHKLVSIRSDGSIITYTESIAHVAGTAVGAIILHIFSDQNHQTLEQVAQIPLQKVVKNFYLITDEKICLLNVDGTIVIVDLTESTTGMTSPVVHPPEFPDCRKLRGSSTAFTNYIGILDFSFTSYV
ncbi:HDL357Wp [Eremothecium sinecaudum]|uniref:HDL357Wp n=1 Tax=Eremothecium sinecaudum TaxID=45286 RepID=A0A109UWV6_9SACH|nr:HDL357Wp [Eremothecium sinecaudum]AMD20387.1 HDL357Wp [Eremothecium sinecaudum]